MNKIIFLDIDGTICFPGEAPTPRTVHAVKSARKNGHKVFLSTGRNLSSLPPAVLEIGYDGYILNAGAQALIEDKKILDISLPQDLVQKVKALFQRLGVYYIIQCEHATYLEPFETYSANPAFTREAVDFLKHMAEIIPLQDMKDYTSQPAYKFNFYAPNRDIFNIIYEELSSDFNFTEFDNLLDTDCLTCAEINYKKFDKGRALQAVCDYYAADLKDCIAFGDSTNDSAMLIAAGLGVAMGNAQEEVKQIADRICPDCREDGLARTLEELGLV